MTLLHFSDEKVGICAGDSGGPLTCPRSNNATEKVLVGIAVLAVGCGRFQRPGIFIRVSPIVDWIRNNLQTFGSEDNICLQSFKTDDDGDGANQQTQLSSFLLIMSCFFSLKIFLL